MAFIGLLMANIILLILFIICIGILIFILIFLILGIVFAIKKRKKLAIVFFSIDGAILIIIACIIAAIYFIIVSPKDKTFETPDGYEKVSAKIVSELEESIENGDTKNVDVILDEYPKLIYYADVNHTGILHKAILSGNVDVAECIIEHGAEFDDEFFLDHLIFDYSFEYYFSSLENSKNSDNIYKVVQFMLENGAEVEYEGNNTTPNVLFQAIWWVCYDCEISDDDIALLNLFIDYGASVTETNSADENVIDYYYIAASTNGISYDNKEFIKGLETLKSAAVE